MEGKTHIGVGLATGAVASLAGGGPEGVQWAALALGAVAPDLDGRESLASTPSAWLPRFIPFTRLLDRLASFVMRIPANIFGHRNTMHYPVVAVGLFLFATSLGLGWLRWVAVGYASHILADFTTKMGVPLLGPLSNKNYGLWPKFLRLKTGGLVEWALSFIVWAGLFLFAGANILNALASGQ